MNKFQKIAYQLAKDDSKKELHKGRNLIKRSRIIYSVWNKERESWPLLKCIDFKNWSKELDF